MVDFVLLPDNAKLSVSYTGEKGIGFLGIKKIWIKIKGLI